MCRPDDFPPFDREELTRTAEPPAPWRDRDVERVCPACGILPAAEGDRYCEDCGSASDRSAWVGGPA